MSTHNTGFYEEISKIITLLSSNTHPISSADPKTTVKVHFQFQGGIIPKSLPVLLTESILHEMAVDQD